jgi:hypothetical protein
MHPSRALLALLLLSACTGDTEVDPSLLVDPTAIDLGVVPLGDAGTDTITLSNTGSGTVTILSASLVEGDSRTWAITHDGLDPLGAGGSLALTVTFTPDEEGASPASLQIRSDDPVNPSVYVTLAATGGAATDDNDGDAYSPAEGDCDDSNPDVNPGAAEDCDGLDTNCDDAIPETEADADGDGWRVCEDDCDDGDPVVYPGAEEICDDKDSDCDGSTPDLDDTDGDGATICDGDCDDEDPAVNADATEVCNDIDDDCSGAADDLDADADGASLCGAVPDCDDDDASAYPVYVDPLASGTGTEADPYATLAEAIAGLDGTCRTIGLQPGAYTEAVVWTAGDVTLVGLASDPSGVSIVPPEGERAFTVTGGAVTLVDLTLTGGTPAEGDGGAVLVDGADLTLSGVIAMRNHSPADGGAFAVSSGVLTMDACVISDNVAGDDGGGVAVVSGTLVDLGSTWSANEGIQGGALLAVSADVTLDGGYFLDNTASGDGGAIALDGASALAIEGLQIFGNTAGGTGGGLSLNDVTDPSGYIRNLTVGDNFAADGGAFGVTGATAELVIANNSLVGNVGTDGAGCADLGATDASALYFWSNICAYNDGSAGVAGGGASVGWNILYGTSTGIEYTGTNDAGENLELDPRFVKFSDNRDPYDDDLTLDAASPAVDSGPTTGPSAYGSWADTDGSTNDRGMTGGQGG